MSVITDTINPQALKAARKRRGMSQKQLADAIFAIAKACTKDTVSRWERGKTRSVRPLLRKPLCYVLRVKWEQLTAPPVQTEDVFRGSKIKVSMGRSVRNSLQIVAERYNIRPSDVLELAPLLFLIIAERSLIERKRRLQEIDKAWEEAEEIILRNRAHLGAVVATLNQTGEDQLWQEEDSINNRDIFGRAIHYEVWNEDDEGPFVHYIRDLVKDLPKDAVTYIVSDGDMIDGYRIADDTLRERTGISNDDEQGRNLLDHIRIGGIDFAECLRMKRDRDEAEYLQWLSNELTRAEEESRRSLESFFALSETFGKRSEL